MFEFTSQRIACDIPALQELLNAPSQVCMIAACGWAYSRVRCGIDNTSKNRKVGKWSESSVDGREVDQISLT